MVTVIDTIIIGAGPAGLSTAIYNATERRSSLVLERAHIGGQARQSARIDNYLGFPKGISGRQLAAMATRQAREYGAQFAQCGAIAIAHDNATALVQTDDGRILPCRSVVIATGLAYRRLNVEGVDNFGIFYGANPDESTHWTGKHVTVIGGANSAAQAILNFAQFAATVTQLTRSPLHKGTSAVYCERIAALHNVATLLGNPVRFSSNGIGLTVETDNGNTFDTDAVFLFIGAEPNCDWLPCDKDAHGFITCGMNGSPTHACSIPGVFVAGDVRAGSSKRVAAGVGEGAIVASQLRTYLAIGKGE